MQQDDDDIIIALFIRRRLHFSDWKDLRFATAKETIANKPPPNIISKQGARHDAIRNESGF